ncbi:MAG: toll/interleukin-1 receptor domain-containing protein, partial [Bacteroidota bacterium]
MKNKIFISHAAPDDNDFTKWLALKLINLGYEVWCDVLFLDKGADFWKSIDTEIRNHSIKFLIVSTSISIQREGVLKELAVAEKVKKKLQDDKFIIPLLLDKELSYDDLPPEIIRLNAIDFKTSWGKGLADLLDAFNKQKVPKDSPDPGKSNILYNQIFLHNKGAIDQEEIHDSNWFPITSFPDELRFHKYDWRLPSNFDVRNLTFPAVRYKGYLCTFAWEYDFMHQLPKTETYPNSDTIRIATKDILNGEYDEEFIRNSEAKRLMVQLINKAFSLFMSSKEIRNYEMSNKTAYWIEKGKLEKDKYEKVQLVGKQKKKN